MFIVIELMFFVIFVFVGFLVVSCGLAAFFVIFLMSVLAFLLEAKHFINLTTLDSSDGFTIVPFSSCHPRDAHCDRPPHHMTIFCVLLPLRPCPLSTPKFTRNLIILQWKWDVQSFTLWWFPFSFLSHECFFLCPSPPFLPCLDSCFSPCSLPPASSKDELWPCPPPCPPWSEAATSNSIKN